MDWIISPTKKMSHKDDAIWDCQVPIFLEKTQEILDNLREYSQEDLQKLWKCNDSLAELNYQRIQKMDLTRALTPAILSYQGLQFQYMAPNVFQEEQIQYVQKHLRIISGFYGIVSPLDGVSPYRLEMAAPCSLAGKKNLYEYWGATLAQKLTEDCDCLINLASKEYSKSILPHLPAHFPCISLSFLEETGGKWKEKATLCKMARGEMIRWASLEEIQSPAEIQEFRGLDFVFCPQESRDDLYVFRRESRRKAEEF